MENAWMKEWMNGKWMNEGTNEWKMHSSYFLGFDEPMQKYNRMKIPSIEGLIGTFIILIGFFF